MSLECVLAFFDFQPSLLNAHLVSAIMPLMLTVLLAIVRDPWMALVLGTNVFLPRFVAVFGKYLVMLRIRPENNIGGDARFEFLPKFGESSMCAISAVVCATLICATAGIAGWLLAVLRQSDAPPAHVQYLTLAYKTKYPAWEIEKLGRKMVLLYNKFALPTVLSPALQMEGIAVTLIISLALNGIFRPYKNKAWNWSEAGLLLVGLTMTSLTTCLLANDSHWARSQATQVVLIFVICCLASGISIAMAVLIFVSLVAERRERQAAKRLKEAEEAAGAKTASSQS
ncbi:unnamed protein product, partial [Symbiodinium necroappetens]